MLRVKQKKEIPNREKPIWVNIGVAFEKEGKISSIKLDVLPIPNKEGEVWLNIFEDQEQADNPWSNNG